jgi:hypothetical protein
MTKQLLVLVATSSSSLSLVVAAIVILVLDSAAAAAAALTHLGCFQPTCQGMVVADVVEGDVEGVLAEAAVVLASIRIVCYKGMVYFNGVLIRFMCRL